jgi:DNA primase
LIPQEFIEEVLVKTDIVEIIESRVNLKKTGQNYSGLCPFHDEKSPSFSVSQDKQFYYCFGCHASGSALKFLMEFDRLDFVSSVEYLSERVGLKIPSDQKFDKGAAQNRKSIFDVLELSALFFREQLKIHEDRERAIEYLKGRGLSGEVARDFGVGFAPPGWRNLMSKLATSNSERKLLIDSGMLTESPDKDKTYDRFRDRIMFPIRDLRGRTIAFGGRVLDDDAKPKYLNSPETDVFRKGRELYGLFEARKRLRKLNKIIVVEGYMDVVALAQHGIHYAVATLGTSTSTEHIERLFRIVPQVIFCFDGDSAGRSAAWKALISALPAMEDGVNVKFLFIPEKDDPDSLVRKEGKEKFEARFAEAQGLTEFFFKTLSADVDLGSVEGLAALSKLAVPLIRQISEGVFKQLMIQELALRTGVDEKKLLDVTDLGKGSRTERLRTVTQTQTGLNQSVLGERATTILLRQPDVANLLSEEDVRELEGVLEWQLLLEIVQWVRQEREASPVWLLSNYQDGPYYEYLRGLVERDLMLSPHQLENEFIETVKKMVQEVKMLQKQRLVGELAQKALSELSPDERKILTDYRRPKRRT